MYLSAKEYKKVTSCYFLSNVQCCWCTYGQGFIKRGLIKITTVAKGQHAVAYIKTMPSASSFDHKMFLFTKVPEDIDR